MKIIFATWLFDKTLGESLTKIKAENRLLSYYFLKEQNITEQQFRQYNQHGVLKVTKK